MNVTLTKSKYLEGLECPKYLWRRFHELEKIRKPTVAEEFKFKQGYEVGELAKTLFPNGIDLPVEEYKINLEQTQTALKKKKPLFEAGFQYENCFSRADILVPAGKEWDIIEVKSGTEVKKINIHDVSFQKWVYEFHGLKIRKCFLMHLNKDYVRKGKVNANKLLIQEDITAQVQSAMEGIEERIVRIQKCIASDKAPQAGILLDKLFGDGHHDCYVENCLDLPENSVFDLYRGGKVSKELFLQGVVKIKDIPQSTKLNEKQRIQRDCAQKNEVHVDKKEIQAFLQRLHYPVYYLDFETFQTAIPMFDGLKSWSQVPFQFSLHIVKKESSKPEHHAFLYEGNSDPRKDFVLALKKVIGEKGTVLVYNQVFEISRLKELAEAYPKEKKWLENVVERIVDLLIPFREFRYYNSKQQGSASIKDVLPALVGDSYKGMEISDGGTASVAFFHMAYENGKDVRDSLLKYCALDTLAEVWIVERLRKIS